MKTIFALIILILLGITQLYAQDSTVYRYFPGSPLVESFTGVNILVETIDTSLFYYHGWIAREAAFDSVWQVAMKNIAERLDSAYRAGADPKNFTYEINIKLK